MQDRYAGDIGDYGKFGLLKALEAQGLSIGVNWYLTKPPAAEKKKDGSFKSKDGKYLVPTDFFGCDRELAEKLNAIAQGPKRSVNALENAKFLSNVRYYDATVTVQERGEWHNRALETLKDMDLIFLDPDNGLLVKSVGKKSARSIKYAFYSEVKDYINMGRSVLIYNHRCRKPAEQYFHDICSKLEESTEVQESDIQIITFPRYSVRDYFAVTASEENRDKIKTAFKSMAGGEWSTMCRIPECKKH